MTHSVISLGVGLGGGKSATSSGRLAGGGLLNTYSVNFDKSDDFCGVSSDPGLSVYALSCWFKPSSEINSSYSGTLVGGWGGPSWTTYAGIRIGMGAGRVLEFNDGLQYIAAGDITSINTNWHHLLVNYVASGYQTVSDPAVASNNGKGYEMWLDGTRVDTALGSTGHNFSLGATTNKFKLAREGERTSYYYGGLMDEVAIFGSSLSLSDICAIYNSGVPTDLTDYSPTLWWRMGDGTEAGSGTTIYDMRPSGTPNNGTLNNGPTYSTDVPS